MYSATARAAVAAAAAASATTTASPSAAKPSASRRRELFGAAACDPLPLPCATQSTEREQLLDADDCTAASAQRSVLLGIAAQLALLCAFMCAFEGHVGPIVVHALLTSDASGELLRIAHALPAFVALLVLLQKTSSTYLWTLQLLVVSQIHSRALFPRADATPSAARIASSHVASAALAAMLLTHALVRFWRPALAAPSLVAAAVVTLAASAVLASIDIALFAGSSLVLLNCGFLACTALVLGVLSSSASRLRAPSSTAALAFSVVALAATALRGLAGVSDSAFVGSLVVQLVLVLLASRELASRRHDRSDDDPCALVDDACAGGAAFQRIELLVTLATAAGALLALLLVATGLRRLV